MAQNEIELSRFRLGVPYYFEQWPCERWETDARLMAEAGITLVRMAEFAWSALEPSRGRYDFSILEEAMGLFALHGIGTILCTPSAAYPPWLHVLHHDIHQVRSNGLPKEYGMRQDACRNHPGYRQAVMKLVRLMAARFGRDERVTAWQIDNELGCHGTARCFCLHCESAFRAWLSVRFGREVERLNAAWGTAFWSQRYRTFREVSIPREPADRMGKEGQNPGLLLDFARFSSETTVRFLAEQASIIRKASPRAVITHNLMKGHFAIDSFRLARELDVVSWDNYPFFELQGADRAPSTFPHAFMRGLKRRNVWIMEQAAGPGGWDFVQPTPEPGRMRVWYFQALARGADTVCFFRWRSARFGIEQYWHGILPHSGIPGSRYREMKQIGMEMRSLAGELEGSVPVARAAILFDQDSHWGLEIQPLAREAVGLPSLAHQAAEALSGRGTDFDCIEAQAEMGVYALVIAPSLHICPRETAQKLERYVEEGGLLVLGPLSGMKDAENAVVEQPFPGFLSPLAGCSVEDADVFSLVPGCAMHVKLPTGSTVQARGIAEILSPMAGTIVLATYCGRSYAERAAATLHRFGKGACLYLGTALDATGLAEILLPVLSERGLAGHPLPTGVEVAARRSPSGTGFRFYLNHSSQTAHVEPFVAGVDLLSGEHVGGTLTLAPLGVAVIKEDGKGSPGPRGCRIPYLRAISSG
jgi:beta-galactosidase